MTRNVETGEDSEVYNSQRLPQVPDTLVGEGGASLLSFKVPVVSKEAVVSSKHCVKLHPWAVDLSEVFSPETSDKEMESEAEIPIRHHQPQLKGFEGGERPKLFILEWKLSKKNLQWLTVCS